MDVVLLPRHEGPVLIVSDGPEVLSALLDAYRRT